LALEPYYIGTNIDIVAAGRLVLAGEDANSGIVSAGAVGKERTFANGDIKAAGGVERHRLRTCRRIARAAGIGQQRIPAYGCVTVPRAGVKECAGTNSRVEGALGVLLECVSTTGRVIMPTNVHK